MKKKSDEDSSGGCGHTVYGGVVPSLSSYSFPYKSDTTIVTRTVLAVVLLLLLQIFSHSLRGSVPSPGVYYYTIERSPL